jgi:hypothetical protein
MKMRIRGNSVRIRLTRTEVAALGAGQSVSQVTAFSPTACLVSSVTVSGEVAAPAATFVDGHVRIVLPLQQARRWAESEEVSISATQPVGEDPPLTLLVEKDFVCLHHPSESVDAFPNPRLGHAP